MNDETMTPPPPAFPDLVVRDLDSANAAWAAGQEIADRLERKAEAEHDEDERERLGDLADALRGL